MTPAFWFMLGMLGGIGVTGLAWLWTSPSVGMQDGS